jgi:hypothetical protein
MVLESFGATLWNRWAARDGGPERDLAGKPQVLGEVDGRSCPMAELALHDVPLGHRLA